MSKKTRLPAGKGRRKPQLDIPLDRIDLDNDNPRLAEEYKSGSQIDLIKGLYENFNLEEIAFSMSENGYFDEEPIVVVPKSLPKSFKWSGKDADTLEEEINDFIGKSDIRFVVVEGNRRVATAKLLSNPDLRNQLKLKEHVFPLPKDKHVEEDIKLIPSIVYPDRSTISPYLGVRHIIGLLKWESYAKALFLAKRIESSAKESSIDDAILEVQKQTGDRSDVIRRQYLYYRLYKEAEEDMRIDFDSMRDRFSLLTVAMNSPAIRAYAGIPSYKDAQFNSRIIPIEKIDKFENLLVWIFGDGMGKDSIINDSRKISSHLARILTHKEATEYLELTGNLDDAYDLSDGEKEFLIKKISDANKSLRKALGIAWKYKTSDIKAQVDELGKAVDELKKMLKK